MRTVSNYIGHKYGVRLIKVSSVKKSDSSESRWGQKIELVIKWRSARELKSENRFFEENLVKKFLEDNLPRRKISKSYSEIPEDNLEISNTKIFGNYTHENIMKIDFRTWNMKIVPVLIGLTLARPRNTRHLLTRKVSLSI